MGVLVFFADFSADDAAHPTEGDAWAEHQYCGGTVVVEAVMLGEVALLCDGCGCRFAARRHDGRRERHADRTSPPEEGAGGGEVMPLRPCLRCGALSGGSYCPAHRPP